MLEGYITPLLMSYLDKYVKNIKPSDLQLSFWGGDAVLRNLVLRVEVLEKELHIPIEFTSGRIRELTLHIPWNAIVSSPVEVTIKDLELVIRLKNVRAGSNVQPSETTDSLSSTVDPPTTPAAVATPVPSDKDKTVEQAPGYLQTYLSRISNNIQVHVHNLVIKIMEEECDLMLTLNIGEVEYFTADENWEKKFIYTDYLQGNYAIHKVCRVSDMTVNLHTIEIGGGKETASHEPFLQRCSFTFRMLAEYRGNIFVKKSSNILFDSLTFSVDEKQFCLFLHLLDWLLAMYYSSKRLKGRDDDVNETQGSSKADTPKSSKVAPILSTPTTPESSKDQLDPPKPTDMSEEANTTSNQSWGTWMWSFVANTDDVTSMNQEVGGGIGRGRQGSKSSAIEPSSTFAVFAKSIQVTFKVTHQVQVPLFYSFRHFTTPVLHVSFTGCMAQLDKVPLTTLFLFSMGIGSVSAAVTGLCPCVKRFPASWRRASTATPTTTADSAEQVQVFSMGVASEMGGASTVGVATSGSDDKYSEKVIEQMLKRSLFVPPTNTEETPPTPDSGTIELPPLSNPGLAQLGDHYTALWFTYQYFDTGPTRSMEECTETLRVGHVTTTLSSDVLHRLRHFIQAFGKSLEANPRFSEGMVVLGDPKAETLLNIELTGIQLALTTNGHFLSTLSTGSPHTTKAKKSSKKAKKPKSLVLPSICVVNSGLTLNFTLPMYSGNASLEVPQKTQLKAKLGDVRSGTPSLQRLDDARNRMDVSKGDTAASSTGSEFKQFLHLPSVEFNYHSKKHGEKEIKKDRTYFQLDIEKIASSLSHTHISKLLFLIGTWTTAECYPSSADIDCPAHPGSKLGHLHLSILNSSVSYSGTDYYSLTSAVVGEFSVAIVKEAAAKRLGCLLPVVYGPIDTHQWNSARFYQGLSAEGLPPQRSSVAAERLVEFYIARPYQNVKDSMFPTFQLSISGCGICFDPSLLQFIRQLPLEAYSGSSNASTDITHTHEAIQLSELEAPPTPGAPSLAADEVQDASSNKLNLLSIMKGYATKVKVQPMIVVFPRQECTSLLSDHDSAVRALPEFPILPLLSSGSSHSSLSPSAVILALPDVLLESARSHVLDEPVPRETQVDTLPWDCSLDGVCAFTVIERKSRYLLEPLIVKATLAPQQEGSGVTIHLDTLTVAASKKQVKLVNSVSHDLIAMVTRPLPSTTSSASLEVEDSGIIVSSLRQGEPSIPPSSILSSPAHSTVTPPTLPAGSEVSTMSSSLVFQGFSTLWIQLLVSKLVINIYNQQQTPSIVQFSGSSEYSTPFTSPSAADKESSSSKLNGASRAASGVSETIKVSLEVDGISLQVDIQERCTDMIFKMASMECSYLKKHCKNPSTTSWLPYLSNSNGKLFSTSSSSLPEELSHMTDPLSHPPLVPFKQAAGLSSPQHHTFSPKLQPNFVQLNVKLPSSQLLQTKRLSLSVKPFEVVAWLPILDTVMEIVSAAAGGDSISSDGCTEHKDTKTVSGGGSVVSWPSVEVNVDCFRLLLPNADHTYFLLLGVGGVSVTSSLDYAGPDVRHVTNSRAFRRLSLLSSERKQPALPAYQVDIISLSLWGVDNSNTSVGVSLFGVCSNLRVVYTPPLFWTPHAPPPQSGSAPLMAPSTVMGPSKSKSSVLATGHCIEINLTSDLVMFCGTEQVHCLSEVMKNNFVTKHAPSADKASHISPAAESSRTTPSKFLLVGRSISLSLLAATLTDEATPTSHAPGLATPLMLATVYNPVCVMELDSRAIKLEASCFNMAVSFSLEQMSLSYVELAAEPLSSLTSVMKQQLLETRKGQSRDKTGLPPSLLSASWSRQSEDLESGSKAGVISLELGRPVKFSLNISFLQEVLRTLVELKKIVRMEPLAEDRNGNGDGVNQNEVSIQDKSSSELFATPQTSMNLSSREHGDLESDLNPTEVIVTTNQVVIEFIITSSDKTDVESESLTSSVAAQEVDVSLQGEPVPYSSKCVTKEGLMLAWQSFTVAIPPANKLSKTSELSLDGLQLLSVIEGLSADILPPSHINCLITQYKPCSTYDLPHFTVKLSCDLFRINLSRTNIELVKTAVDGVTELLQKSSNEMAPTESCDSEPVVRGDSCREEIQFTDDLRTEEFNYIVNESSVPQVPLPGNIVFHHGNGGIPPTMTWQYGEPRAITKLSVLPVPFTITTEEDAPVDIKLSCSLEYWSEVESSYEALAHFHVSESNHVEWELPSSVSHGSVASRRWRITVNHLEWTDEDLEEIITESVTSVSGTTMPLSSVLSPVSLAACTRVDSLFSPRFIPLLSLSLHCHRLQLSILHHPHKLPPVAMETHGTTSTYAGVYYEGYKVLSSHQSQEAQELFRITLDEARLFLSQRRDSNALVKVDTKLEGEYVDGESLVWRYALYPTEAGLLVEHRSEHKGSSLSGDSCSSGLSVSLSCGPSVLRLSQSLVHTTSMAINLWREKSGVEREGGERTTSSTAAATLLTGHYVLCNDTLDDIHFGQVATGEDLLLPSNSCISYSWRNHKANLKLHVCVVCDGSWRWTKPFSIGEAGIQAIDIPIGRYMATLLIKINLIGGLQKQVTFLGSWKFFSFLHFPLELQLTLATQSQEEEDIPHSQQELTTKRRSSTSTAAPTPPQQLKVLTLHPQESLPSIVAVDSLVGGVRFRMATGTSGGMGGSGRWSKIYPLGSSVHQWSKPHLLAELSHENGESLHFWYNTTPLETASKKVWGNKISFSPLFAITNHLPYDLTVARIDSQTLPTHPTTPSSPGSLTSVQEEWLLPGGGATKPLYSLSADSWYHLQFNISCSSPTEWSDPSLALSTFLLHHLPISKDDLSLDQNTSDNPSKPAIAYISLPLGDGSSCTVHAALVRNALNTITAVLQTDVVIVNECPWEIELVELIVGESEEREALWEGKILIGERREKTTVLGPTDKAVCVQKQFMLAVKWKDMRLTSKPLSFPTLQLSQQKSKGTDSNKTAMTVQMMSDSNSIPEEGSPQVVGEVSLSFLKQDTTITATLKPSYVIHNSTDSCIHAWPCVLNKHQAPVAKDIDPDFSLVKEIQPSITQPILLWQRSVDSSGKALTPAFRLAVASSPNFPPPSWSILLSPRFVRHSFSLPTNDSAQSSLPTLVTMHELENTTYLVIACDPSPRLLVQNLCPTVLEVVQTDAKGIHASPQLLLPGHEVVYDPPSLAKLYPVVYDSDIASEEEMRLHSRAQKVSLCFRVKATPTQGFGKGWSQAYPLANEQDIVLGIPEHGDVLISMDRCGHSQFISILPTGEIQPVQRTTNYFAGSLNQSPKKELKFSCSLTRLVVCLDDDTASQKMINQVLQIVADEAEILYWRSNTKGTKVELTLRSLQIDNKTVQSSAEFSVVLLPRSEHAARPQLIKNEPPSLVRALLQYNPRMDNVIDLVHVMIQPVTVQLEDSLLHRLRAILPSFSSPGVIRITSMLAENISTPLSSLDLYVVPVAVLKEADIDTSPLIISRLVIGPSAIYLTASITLKAFLSCRDSPFRFSKYELTDISSNLSEVSQVVAARYVSAVFMHLGWLLGSLELIGSPGTFLQTVGSGLRDLISLPYEGLTRSPGLFILGIGHGAVSFVRNFSTGALTSITNFASSIARNMERLSMDSDHASYQDQKRKEQPTTHFTSGISTGVSSFGLSLISAVAGIVDQPMQSFQRIDESSSALSATRSVLAGVGKGLIGVVTKPVGGAMELVSHTGQGIMHGTGLIPKLKHRSIGQELEPFTQSLIKSEFNSTVTSCQRKLEHGPCIAMVNAVRANVNESEQNVLLLLTLDKLYLLDCHSNSLQQHFSVEHTQLKTQDNTPHRSSGLVEIHVIPCSKSATNRESGALSPSSFPTVEYYLKLSQLEAQTELPVAASGNTEEDDNSLQAVATQSDVEKYTTSSNSIVVVVGEQEAAQFLSIYQSIRGHSLEPELSFCVYSSLMAALTGEREESFFSASSQPTL